ncbi:unnamed protein product [Mytilus coruscus]|uniref:Uncharacterized protein n=1 Tax=Mytilus coruscus TaxID=42192 RepID=A0A6J8CTL0_MYTCO|nr:unnamed protein product [Mytilus coruscus]
MGSAVSSNKQSKQNGRNVNETKTKNIRPVSTDSGYRSPEVVTERNTSNKIVSQRKISDNNTHLFENGNIRCDKGYKSFEQQNKENKDIGHQEQMFSYQNCFEDKRNNENVFILDGIDTDLDPKSNFENDEDDMKQDSLRNIFIPGAVFNYDRIINIGKADDLVARIAEEKQKPHKQRRRPKTAVSTDIEIDLEEGTESIKRKPSTAIKTKYDDNTRNPKNRPRAAIGQRRKTVSDISCEFINSDSNERKSNKERNLKTNKASPISFLDALNMFIEQGTLNETGDMAHAYKVDITVDLNSDTLKIIIPGSYLCNTK